MKDTLQDWSKRAQRYWYVDGLSEVGGGFIILLISMFYAATGLLEDGKVKGLFSGLGMPVLIIGLSLLMRWIVQSLKERITYPRTGYIAYRRTEPRRRVGGILIAIIFAAAIGMLVFLSRSWLNLQWLPAITGLFAAMLTLIIALRIRLPRFFILAAYTLAVGIATGFLGLADPYDTALFLSGIGLGWLVAGAITLNRYLRGTKPAETTIDDGDAG